MAMKYDTLTLIVIHVKTQSYFIIVIMKCIIE